MTSFSEDRIPVAGIEQTISELVELYGGEVTSSGAQTRSFVLPLRRGVAASGGVACTISWTPDRGTEGTVTLECGREVDAPRAQRILMLALGVAGAVSFMLWPFFADRQGSGALAWIGGALAIAVYLMTLRRTSGGIAADFLERLANRQRSSESPLP